MSQITEVDLFIFIFDFETALFKWDSNHVNFCLFSVQNLKNILYGS